MGKRTDSRLILISLKGLEFCVQIDLVPGILVGVLDRALNIRETRGFLILVINPTVHAHSTTEAVADLVSLSVEIRAEPEIILGYLPLQRNRIEPDVIVLELETPVSFFRRSIEYITSCSFSITPIFELSIIITKYYVSSHKNTIAFEIPDLILLSSGN